MVFHDFLLARAQNHVELFVGQRGRFDSALKRAIAEATNPSEGALLATHLIEYGYDIRTVPEAVRFVDDNDLHPCS